MTRLAALGVWGRHLGLDTEVLSEDGTEKLRFRDSVGGDIFVVPDAADLWMVSHIRSVSRAALTDWEPAGNAAHDAVALLQQTTTGIVELFPLVTAAVRVRGDGVAVELTAPLVEPDLSPQAFLLTVASLVSASRALTEVLASRAELVAARKELERELAARDAASRASSSPSGVPITSGPPGDSVTTSEVPMWAPHDAAVSTAATEQIPSPLQTATGAATLPTAWSPTHEARKRAQAWERPDPNSAVTGMVERRIPVQVLEREGDWAHVVCSNGWSAWIDGRNLKAR
jgi:hypothetical protein